MRRYRKYAALALLLAALAFCAGCGRNDHSLSGSGREVTITVWHPWGGVYKERLTALVDQFNRSHPGIRVKLLYTPTDLGSNQKFFTAVAANEPPDVVFVDGTQSAAWAEQGAIQPLEDRIRRDGFKQEEFFEPCWNRGIYNGHIWSLTFNSDPCFAFVWNKKVFREAGLDPDKAPRTIEELDRYNNIVTKVENGKLTRIGFIPWSLYGNANSLFTWGWAFKGSFYDPKARRITADNENVVRALEWMVSYSKKYDIRKINAFASGFGSREQNPLYTGQMAMTCMLLADVEDIKRYAPNLDYGIGFIPVPRGGEEHSSWVGGWSLALPRGSKHPREGWEFIKWCCRDPRGTTAVGRIMGLIPGCRNSPYLREIEGKPGSGIYLRILRECRHQRPLMPAQAFYMSALDKAVDYAIYGKMSARQALENATRDTQAELDLKLAGR